GGTWTPVESALAHLRAGLVAVTEVEVVPLWDAAGRALAAPTRARRAHPPTANAAVDGYAFAAPGERGGALSLPLLEGRAAAGYPFDGPVPGGHAVRILTGAPLPLGVDTVVLQEDVQIVDGRLDVPAGWRRGANARDAGEDLTAGQALLQAGHRLRAPDLALLAAAGLREVAVHRPLRVALLSTGDELAPDGQTAAGSEIPDANRPMLAAALAAWGAEVVDLGQAPDQAAAVEAALDRGRETAHAIVTTGGASAGDEDHISAALRTAGTLGIWRIAMKPGRPLALGLWRGTPVFGLPGNPVAAFTCAALFARPALAVLAGATWPEPAAVDVPAAFEKTKKAGRRELLRARLVGGRAEVFASEGSGRVSGLSWADGFVELLEPAQSVRPGDPVRYISFASLGL
ncbi:MAG: molybdopterin-binding protein, partial [Pseudomonadota bacterium]